MLIEKKQKALFLRDRSKERGGALWFILLAVALFGALTMVLSRSGSQVDQAGDVEQAKVKASQIMRTAKSIEAAIQQMQMRGISESDISFENSTTTTDYTNANCANDECKIFHVNGGGLTYSTPNTGMNDGSHWIFTGANNVGTSAGPVGTTASGTGNDLLMLLPNAKTALCKQINRDLGVGTAGTIPVDEGGILTTAFTGTYQKTALKTLDGDATPFELNKKRAGCFTDDVSGVTYFYAVLLAR